MTTLAILTVVLAVLARGGEQPSKFSNPIVLAAPGPMKPNYPQCDLKSSDGELTIEETTSGGWSCVVRSSMTKPMAVRVQMAENNDNPTKDQTVEYYYKIDANTRGALLMQGQGRGTATCRLCGAAEWKGSQKGTMEALELNADTFSCQRRCSATLYQHRNWNGMAVTLTSNTPDLKSTRLIQNGKAQLSSLRINGYGCEVRLWEDTNYGVVGNGNPTKPVCTFVNTIKDPPGGRSSMAWDMDAVRKICDKCSSGTGQDCIKSAAIREVSQGGVNSYCASSNSGSATPGVCNGCVPVDHDVHTAVLSKQEALKRLFTAMSNFMEDDQ